MHASQLSPARHLSRSCPESAVKLMRLEATVFEAMAGDRESLEQLPGLWYQIQELVPDNLVASCRAQFVQFALDNWRDFNTAPDRNPLRADSALDVVCLLFDSGSLYATTDR